MARLKRRSVNLTAGAPSRRLRRFQDRRPVLGCLIRYAAPHPNDGESLFIARSGSPKAEAVKATTNHWPNFGGMFRPV